MTATETELKQQEFEQVSLQNTVSNLQAALLFATGDGRKVLETAYRNASGRLATVETKVKDLQGKHEAEVKEESTRVATLAAQETRLNAQEKETFAGFMKKDFFTRGDFGRLEDFYKKSYARLSEHGKDEMSHRIWEGIRKHEYTFGELPPTVREKESKRVYDLFKNRPESSPEVANIPEKDRQDFIRAHEAGKKDQEAKILERDSFKQNLFRGSDEKAIKSVESQVEHKAERTSLAAKIDAHKSSGGEKENDVGGGKANDGFGDLVDGLQLADSSRSPSSADVPRGVSVTKTSGPSLPGG